MSEPQHNQPMEAGVHVWPDPFDRGWVHYYLVLNDGRLAQERRIPAELDGEWVLDLAHRELERLNARFCVPGRVQHRLSVLT